MRIQALVRLWMVFGLSALGFTPTSSASTPSPGRDQKWMTAEEFTTRWPTGELGGVPRPWPVLILPEGSEIPLRFLPGELGALELREDAVFPLRARKNLYLDLESFMASTDKVTWSSITDVLCPMRSVTCSLVGAAGKPEVVVVFRGRN